MNLDRLKVFLQIVDSGSMSAAARAVHLTQPALSRTLKLFEEEMGVSLFARRGRALVLTAGGRALVPRGRALLAEGQRVRLEVGRSAERAYFDLRLGAIDSVATHLLPAVLPVLRAAFPTLAVKLSTARTAMLLRRARASDLDLVVVAHSGMPPDARARSLGAYRLQFFGRRDLFPRLAQARTEAEVQAFPIVEIDPGHGEPGLAPDDALSYAVASNVSTVKALVLAGFGVGDLPDFMLSAGEAATLGCAQVPHDPDCGLFLVAAPRWQGVMEARIEATIARELARLLGERTRRRGQPPRLQTIRPRIVSNRLKASRSHLVHTKKA
ncbi:MAG: LysR family transcriptional regulator [Myxococcales bacterium]